MSALGAGGLSGPVLAERSKQVLRLLRDRLPAETVVISVGGVVTAADVAERLSLGADLVQGYSAASDTLSELVARPQINLYRPELAGLIQPVSSALAVRRTVLERLSLRTGDTFGLALLLDVAETLGPEAVAQVELDPGGTTATPDTPEAAYEVLTAVCARAHGRRALDELGPGPLLVPAADHLERRRTNLTERPAATTLATHSRTG